MIQEVALRHATPKDLPLLQKWDQQPHVVESDPNDDWGWETELSREVPWREQLMAEVDGVPIGFVQIIDPKEEESHYWGEIAAGYKAVDIWIGESEYLGKGYGTQIMKLAIDRCFAEKSTHSILIDPLESNVRAHKFYERLGFEFLEKRKFGADDCKVYILRRP